MRKLILVVMALQLSVAGLFAESQPVQKKFPLPFGATAPSTLSMRGILSGGSIKVLSWNIFMLPNIAGKTGQEMRAKGIIDALKDTDYDVIVFQEAWTRKTRDVIWAGLKATYPYDAGEPLKGGFTITNSGVWIISKLPIKTRIDKLYRECDGADCFAKKGATLVEVEKDGKTFQIIGTHLQADEGKAKQKVRNEQYYDLGKLLGENHKDGVAQIIAGDFNTPITDTTRYNYMLRSVKMEDGPLSGNMQYTWDNSCNDITRNGKDTCQVLLDYIFTRDNGFNFTSERRVIKRFQVRWACDKIDLSDHFAMEGVFEY